MSTSARCTRNFFQSFASDPTHEFGKLHRNTLPKQGKMRFGTKIDCGESGHLADIKKQINKPPIEGAITHALMTVLRRAPPQAAGVEEETFDEG